MNQSSLGLLQFLYRFQNICLGDLVIADQGPHLICFAVADDQGWCGDDLVLLGELLGVCHLLGNFQEAQLLVCHVQRSYGGLDVIVRGVFRLLRHAEQHLAQLHVFCFLVCRPGC